MESTKIEAEARAALEEAERRDPEAHGYTKERLLDMAEMLRASAGYVTLNAEASRAREVVVRLARRVTEDHTLTDEEAIRVAGALAMRLLPAVTA